ncbi:hypothetical protein SKAU_G00309860 [Synaphobranchus kaupii]|uniref:Uncharacterized protein n=1 Tax=Synaphobranchus kaupii TaxID=118154 RepID=A0A9Q1ERK6_SYNKA|nr:hypothetical protein SKAU_G00309860 [Synaphobranchus kaupii]
MLRELKSSPSILRPSAALYSRREGEGGRRARHPFSGEPEASVRWPQLSPSTSSKPSASRVVAGECGGGPSPSFPSCSALTKLLASKKKPPRRTTPGVSLHVSACLRSGSLPDVRRRLEMGGETPASPRSAPGTQHTSASSSLHSTRAYQIRNICTPFRLLSPQVHLFIWLSCSIAITLGPSGVAVWICAATAWLPALDGLTTHNLAAFHHWPDENRHRMMTSNGKGLSLESAGDSQSASAAAAAASAAWRFATAGY